MASGTSLAKFGQGLGPVDLARVWDNHRMRFPVVLRPIYSVKLGNCNVELWHSHRRLPMLLTADGVIVPVSPSLKLVAGVAKVVRDYGANVIQYEANRVAPLPPGEAFVGSGGRYRFRYTALAVIFDEQKRTDPSIIRRAVRNAAGLLVQKGCKTVVLPDFTENLVPQPNWLSQSAYRATAEATAASLSAAVQACAGVVPRLRVWTWNPVSRDIYLRELRRLERSGH